MKKRNYSSRLKCDSCGNYHYQWWMISHKKKISQKIGCASSMRYIDGQYLILCCYGSGYDTLSFKVLKRPAKLKRLKAIDRLIEQVKTGFEPVICDKCLTRFIKKKVVAE